jgi:hypothetical protein
MLLAIATCGSDRSSHLSFAARRTGAFAHCDETACLCALAWSRSVLTWSRGPRGVPTPLRRSILDCYPRQHSVAF